MSFYKKYEVDDWQLFNLEVDPREEHDVAAEHPDVVERMAAQHEAWVKTLAPLGEIPNIRDSLPIIPSGHGWAISGEGE